MYQFLKPLVKLNVNSSCEHESHEPSTQTPQLIKTVDFFMIWRKKTGKDLACLSGKM